MVLLLKWLIWQSKCQAAERGNNAGRVIGQLSEANRGLYPTRVHYIVISRCQSCEIGAKHPAVLHQPLRHLILV